MKKQRSLIIIISLFLLIAIVVGGVILYRFLSSKRAERQLAEAQEFLASGNYESAISVYSEILAADPNCADAYYGLAQAYFESEAYDLALETAKNGYEKTNGLQLWQYVSFLEKDAKARDFKNLPYYVKEAVCAYYDLLDHQEITQEMLDSVESILFTVARYELADNGTDYICYIDAYINGSPCGIYLSPFIRPNRMENKYLSQIEDEFYREWFFVHYVDKNLSDPSWSPAQKEDLLVYYPFLAMFESGYVLSNNLSSNDQQQLFAILKDYGFDHESLAVEKTIDLSSMKALPNLTKIEYLINSKDVESSFGSIEEYKHQVGLTFINAPIAIDEIVRELTDASDFWKTDSGEQPESGSPDAPTIPPAEESNIDNASLERILEVTIDLSKLQFGPFFMACPVTSVEDAGGLIGSDSFSGEFTEALAYMPMMGSEVFQLILFRLPDDADAFNFAKDLESKANLQKWLFTSAEAMDTCVIGQTVLFVMASNKQTTALLNAFTTVAAPGFDIEGYEMRDPLDGVTMEDIYDTLAENCMFLTGTDKGNVSTSTPFGLGALDISSFTDSLIDYELSGRKRAYVIAMFRLAEGQDAAAFATNLKNILDTSSLNMSESDVQASYSENVVVICVGAGELENVPSDIVWLLEIFYNMTIAD